MIQVIYIKSSNRLTVSGDEEGMYSRVTPESKIYISPVTCRAVDPSDIAVSVLFLHHHAVVSP